MRNTDGTMTFEDQLWNAGAEPLPVDRSDPAVVPQTAECNRRRSVQFKVLD